MRIRQKKFEKSKKVFLVAAGPSAAALPWPDAYYESCEQNGTMDLCLLNRMAIGKQVPNYCVTVNPELLAAYSQDLRISQKSIVITNPPHKLAPILNGNDISAALTSKKVFWHDRWPVLASPSLAVWAMSFLGYGQIYLFGFDGSMASRDRRYARGEQWINRFIKARNDHHKSELIRVWPNSVEWKSAEDPLRTTESMSVVIP